MELENRSSYSYRITVFDPRCNRIHTLDYTPTIKDRCWIWLNGELREIRDIHKTSNGEQIELMA